MRNLFRLFVPLIINPYYYYAKFKRDDVNNFFNYENSPYNRLSLISLAVSQAMKKKGYENCNYLEIGCFDDEAFNSIPLPLEQKIGIDPMRGGTHRMTSDVFFSNNKKMFDVIFIDGLHTYDQCSKDCINAMNFLNEDGIIIIHDMMPRHKIEESQKYSGDVWKVAYELSKSENVKFIIANMDQGVGLLKLTNNFNYIKQFEINKKNFNDYKNFYYKQLPSVNIKTALDFIKS
jgi:hypothetical protein|tara:strand:+ start:2512 stop:3210 length:699 start_codon:yes stop_codon:yes gene_type:complete